MLINIIVYKLEHKVTLEYVEKHFDATIIPNLMEYIKIDNLSPNFDLEWATNGKAEKAAEHLLKWALIQGVKGLKGEVQKKDGLSPIIFIEIESNGGNGNIFMYGHFDKQPHFDGWMEGTGPTSPVIRGDYLYGRGGADDGYAIFSSLLSIKAIQDFGHKHGKVTILIEGSEESGSIHLFQYIESLEERIGNPDLMVCLDFGCKDYERLWITTSLRGLVCKDVEIACLKDSVHSGVGTGHAPDSFSVGRILLDRIDNPKTGKVRDEFQVDIPLSKYAEAKSVSNAIGSKFVLVNNLEGVNNIADDLTELYLNGTWRATLCVIGLTGLPQHNLAGNVLRDKTSFRLSMRLPPTKEPQEASNELDSILLENPPFNSKITIEKTQVGSGWAAGPFSEKLSKSLKTSSLEFWGKEEQTFGEGVSIPFINSLAKKFSKSDFLVLGVLGPNSNAHAANECLNIPYCKRVTSTLIHAVYDLFN